MKFCLITILSFLQYAFVVGDGTVRIAMKGLACPRENYPNFCSECAAHCSFHYRIVVPRANNGTHWTQFATFRETFSDIKAIPNEVGFASNIIEATFRGSWMNHYPVQIHEWVSRRSQVQESVYRSYLNLRIPSERSVVATVNLEGKDSIRLIFDVQVVCASHFYGNCSKLCVDKEPKCCDAQGHLRCCKNFFGGNCDRFCEARDDEHGHFECDDEGRKVCLSGWSGAECQAPHRLEKRAAPSPDPTGCVPACEHGGSCLLNGSAPKCSCTAAFRGTHCEFDRDECKEATKQRTVMCFNDGVCFNLHGSYECVCPAAFRGSHCELKAQAPDERYGDRNIIHTYQCLLFYFIILVSYHFFVESSPFYIFPRLKRFGRLVWMFRYEVRKQQAQRKEQEEEIRKLQLEVDRGWWATKTLNEATDAKFGSADGPQDGTQDSTAIDFSFASQNDDPHSNAEEEEDSSRWAVKVRGPSVTSKLQQMTSEYKTGKRSRRPISFFEQEDAGGKKEPAYRGSLKTIMTQKKKQPVHRMRKKFKRMIDDSSTSEASTKKRSIVSKTSVSSKTGMSSSSRKIRSSKMSRNSKMASSSKKMSRSSKKMSRSSKKMSRKKSVKAAKRPSSKKKKKKKRKKTDSESL